MFGIRSWTRFTPCKKCRERLRSVKTMMSGVQWQIFSSWNSQLVLDFLAHICHLILFASDCVSRDKQNQISRQNYWEDFESTKSETS